MTGSSTPGSAERARWLLREIGSFLGDATDPAIRDAFARDALRNGHHDFESFATSRCAPDDVAVVRLDVLRDDAIVRTSWYRQVPSPIGLLVVCAGICVDGDRVRLVQITASLTRVTAEDDWPFGLATAEQMSIPATVRVRAAAARAGTAEGVAGSAAEGVSRGSAARGSATRPADG